MRALGLGIPPVATPLVYLIVQAGCWAGFKDRYIAEGGREGPRKLQGFKALNGEHERRKAVEIAEELKSLLDREPKGHPDLKASSREGQRRFLGLSKSSSPRHNHFLHVGTP